MSVLWVGFNLHKTLLSMIDLVMRFTWYDFPQNEKNHSPWCRTDDGLDRRYSDIIQGMRDPLQMRGALKSNKLEIHLKSFRSTSLIGTIGVMASISAFQAGGTGSNPVWCSII